MAGYGQGRAARRERAKLHSSGGGSGDQTHLVQQASKAVAPEFCRPVVGEEEAGSTWTVVETKKKKDSAPVQKWMIDPLVGGLIGVGMAKKRHSDGDKLNAHLVVACEQSELDALLSLARAHALQDKISVVCRFNPEQEATALQLPSIGPKGQRQVRSWPTVPLGSGGGPDMKHRAVLRSAFKAPDRKLVTLRLQVPKVFQEPTSWTALCKQPNDRARQALGPIHSFGPWQKLQAGEKHSREEVLECYVKVGEVDKAAVLSRSGVEGVFTAELAKDAQKPVVDWLPAGETEGPAYLMLAMRKAQETKSSLAFRRGGGASLGVKVSADAAGDRTCTWRARQVPRLVG